MAHTELHKYFEDSIGMVSNWKTRGPVYEVPFRTLYSSKVKNLICAGRCTSVNETLWDVMRVIPCCAVTGEAAGTAAAMTDDFSTLDVKALQEKLVANGVVLHEEDLIKDHEKIAQYKMKKFEGLLVEIDTVVEPDIEELTVDQLQEYLADLEVRLDELEDNEPDTNSDEFDEWDDKYSEIEDLIDEVEERLKELGA